MRNNAITTRQMFGSAAKVALVVAMMFAPIAAVQKVNASAEQTIGEMQKMSNGAGLVLVLGLQRG